MRRVNSRSRAALLGWVGIVVTVAVTDDHALRHDLETMSSWFRRHRWVVGPVWAALTWHLVAGDVRILSDVRHGWYVRYHPLWRLVQVRGGLVRMADVTIGHSMDLPRTLVLREPDTAVTHHSM